MIDFWQLLNRGKAQHFDSFIKDHQDKEKKKSI
uniref:Uncharacterized protein n=1 Tax=Tetranychus urticae TaxID=32264 RepID=T1KKJ6_TETUR